LAESSPLRYTPSYVVVALMTSALFSVPSDPVGSRALKSMTTYMEAPGARLPTPVRSYHCSKPIPSSTESGAGVADS